MKPPLGSQSKWRQSCPTPSRRQAPKHGSVQRSHHALRVAGSHHARYPPSQQERSGLQGDNPLFRPTWKRRMSRGFPAFFRQFWLHLRKNLRKNLKQCGGWAQGSGGSKNRWRCNCFLPRRLPAGQLPLCLLTQVSHPTLPF